ncbi:MAG: PilZ domain-containing protein [Desulfobacterales bacterium]|nr:PilZ domain-containing protein [Desulfobacterales bacterium]
MATQTERRKHTRFSIKNGSYATISPNSSKIGQIVDISMGGLAFKYIDTKPDKNKNKRQETLFLSSMGYYVGNIDFKTVADYEVPGCEIPESPSGAMKIRIKHVKFTDLKLKQLFDLDYYIGNNAIETNDCVSIQ